MIRRLTQALLCCCFLVLAGCGSQPTPSKDTQPGKETVTQPPAPPPIPKPPQK